MVGESFSASGALSLAAAVGASEGIHPADSKLQEKDPSATSIMSPIEAQREADMKHGSCDVSADPYGRNTCDCIRWPSIRIR